MASSVAAFLSSPSPKVAVLGPGAVGMLLAARLQLGGVPALLVDHRADRAERLNLSGVRLLKGDQKLGEGELAAVPATADASAVAGGKSTLFLLVLVKSFQTRAAVESIAKHLPEAACLVTLQNGIGNAARIREAGWAGRVLAGTTAQGARIEAEGVVRDTGTGMNVVGPTDDDPEAVALVGELEELFRKAGLPFTAAKSPKATDKAIFTKAVINAALNPVAALTRLPNGVCGTPGSPSLDVMVGAAVEAAKVAAAKGVDFDTTEDYWRRRIGDVCAATAANTNSMLVDVLKARRTEIGEINAEFVRLGAELGIGCPVNRVLAGLITTMEGEYGRRVGN
ncbi:ketopantoate reductase PanE/ApbA-domain-containing protein [Hyaloraphidium curvatum]|nr:ketopantoate reductase PanE/ApbA-domain-containing protein [Hyaloraphidium curvatum]